MIGGGQLAWLFGEAAHKAGYRFHVLSPDPNATATRIADSVTVAAFDDSAGFVEFARGVSALTIDTEHIGADALAAAAEHTQVWPAPEVIAITQSRIRQREALAPAGLPLVPYLPVRGVADLVAALAEIGAPAILKSATEGYDGKGQVRIAGGESADQVWESLGAHAAVLERFIPFAAEFSVIVARDASGQSVAYEPFENVHTEGILDTTTWPSRLDERLAGEATSIARRAAEALGVVGLLCVECFLLDDGAILINECAARPHNSGHLTIDAAESSQYDELVRVLAGLPLAPTRRLRAAAMANLVGLLHVESSRFVPTGEPDITLYDYGKSYVDRRKLGHIVAIHPTDPAAALARALAERTAIAGRARPASRR